MLVHGIMTRNVITVSPKTSIADALKIMKAHNIHHLPVVDDNGQLVGTCVEDRLERIKPPTGAPRLWQMLYLFYQLSHTTVGSIMRRKVVTVKPSDTVEEAVTKFRTERVGVLVVVEGDKIVGICTPNDFFNRIISPTLSLGESGTRILIDGGGDGKSAEKIIGYINRLGIGIKLIWTSLSSETGENDITLHLDTEDATNVIQELKKLGYSTGIRPR